jgi:hypothetical protein
MASAGQFMSCGNCAEPSEPDARFCGACGSRLSDGEVQPGDAREALAPIVQRPKLIVSLDDQPRPMLPVPTARPQAMAAAPPTATQLAVPVVLPEPSLPDAITHPVYTVCAIREVVEDELSMDEGLIFPIPAMDADTVMLEQRDGGDVQRVLCNEIEVTGGESNERLLRTADIRGQVLITDARLTVACSKFDKGGGWVGGPVAMIALNAGSKLLAAHRRRGKMLVGHVRYPWIRAVYAQNKGGWTGAETMRIIVKSGDEPMRLELTFPKDVDATAVATEVIRRAARFRLAHEPDLDANERTQLSELCNIPPLVWRRGDKNMVGHRFPTYWPAGPRSASFGLPRGGA